MIYEKNMKKAIKTQEKSQTQGEIFGMNVSQLIKSLENKKLISIFTISEQQHKYLCC